MTAARVYGKRESEREKSWGTTFTKKWMKVKWTIVSSQRTQNETESELPGTMSDADS